MVEAKACPAELLLMEWDFIHEYLREVHGTHTPLAGKVTEFGLEET